MLKILFYQSPKYRAFDEMLKKFRFLIETETLKNGFLSLFLGCIVAKCWLNYYLLELISLSIFFSLHFL